MTVASETSRNDYVGDGTKASYDYTFRIFAATDLRVTKVDTDGVETALVYGVDYTVAGVGSFAGGSITLLAGNLPAGYGLAIRFRTTLTQGTDLRNQAGFFPETIEDALDRITKIAQQQQDELDRSVQLPETEPGPIQLPTKTTRKSKFLGCDSNGDIVAADVFSPVPATPFVETLLDDLTASEALTTLGFSAFIKTLIDDANAAAALTTLGVSAFIQTLLNDADAPTARATLGISNFYKVSVADHGAVGDGATDDTVAIHAARDAAGVGGIVVFPPGTYIADDLIANVADQTWVMERGAVIKQKSGSTSNLLTVSGARNTIVGWFDGNRAGAPGGGMINVPASTLTPRFFVDVKESSSYGIYAPDVSQLYVRGKFIDSSKPAIFNTMVTSVTDLFGPDIDIEVDFSGESTNDPALQAILIRGNLGVARYQGCRIRADVRMPINPTPSAELCCEIRSCRNVEVDLHTYGGSIACSLVEVDMVSGHVNGKAFNHYGVEYGGACIDCNLEGNVDGTNNSGTNLALYPIAFQGTTGLNERCSFRGTARGSAGASQACTIFYDNGIDCSFHGDLYCGASLYALRMTANCDGGFALHGRFFGETGGDYIAYVADNVGGLDIRGYAKDFDVGGAYLYLNSAVTMDNISMSVNFENCNGGGFVSSVGGGGVLGEYISAKGCTGQYVGGGGYRADIINWKRNICAWEGAGSPEGTVAAGIGSTFRRNDGGNSDALYVKSTGTGNTGWQTVVTKKGQGAASAWIRFDGTVATPTVVASYGGSSPSVSKAGTGQYTISWGVTFDTAAYIAQGAANGGIVDFTTLSTTQTGVRAYNDAGTYVDPTAVMVVLFGAYNP